jgi:soluble lytic murein transglycosylase
MAKAELVLGNANAAQKKWKEAIRQFENAFQRIPSLALVEPRSLGLYALACSKLPSQLCPSWLQRFAKVYPKNSEEITEISKYQPSVREAAKPARPVGRVSQTYKAPDRDQAALEPIVQKFVQKEYGDVIDLVEEFLHDFPRSSLRFRARFLMAQSYFQKGKEDEARNLYNGILKESPLSYYGLLSSLGTGQPVDAAIDARIPLGVSMDQTLTPSELYRLRRAEKLTASGSPELARNDLSEIHPRSTMSEPFLMYLATLNSAAHNHLSAFIVLSELLQRDYDGVTTSHGVHMIFPLEQWDLIQKTAADVKIDPILVLSLIKQESAFDIDALSGSGATGLMQLMPFTAVDTEPNIKRADLIKAEHNIRIGAKYLKKLIDRFNGNIALALAAYNAGPTPISRWVREGRARSGLVEFIEQIPYKETQNYVGSIIRNYYWYSRRLSGEYPKNISMFWVNAGTPPEAAE